MWDRCGTFIGTSGDLIYDGPVRVNYLAGIWLMSFRYMSFSVASISGCYYEGMLEPEDDIIADVWETVDYIREAEEMAVV